MTRFDMGDIVYVLLRTLSRYEELCHLQTVLQIVKDGSIETIK